MLHKILLAEKICGYLIKGIMLKKQIQYCISGNNYKQISYKYIEEHTVYLYENVFKYCSLLGAYVNTVW